MSILSAAIGNSFDSHKLPCLDLVFPLEFLSPLMLAQLLLLLSCSVVRIENSCNNLSIMCREMEGKMVHPCTDPKQACNEAATFLFETHFASLTLEHAS